jgi:hypothetical protein
MAQFAQAEAATVMGMATSITRQKWFRPYLAMAIVTLLFQIWVRSYECVGLGGCGLSFAKAVVWSVIWPASWVVYINGQPWVLSLLR